MPARFSEPRPVQCAACWCDAVRVPERIPLDHPATVHHYTFVCQFHWDYPTSLLCPDCCTERTATGGWLIHDSGDDEVVSIRTLRDQGYRGDVSRGAAD